MFEIEIFGPCLVKKLKWGGQSPPGHPSGYTPIWSTFIFFKCSMKIKKNYKKAKNGRRSINSEETTEERKSWEYILPMRIQITRKHKCHIKMIRGGFHNNHNILKNRLQRSLYLKSLFKSLTLSKPVKRIYTFLWSFPVVYKYFFCLP